MNDESEMLKYKHNWETSQKFIRELLDKNNCLLDRIKELEDEIDKANKINADDMEIIHGKRVVININVNDMYRNDLCDDDLEPIFY